MASVLAAADIGSNTAHLLVAATDGQLVMRIDNASEWIPLGEEVSRLGEIPKERIDELIGALKEFRRVCLDRGSKSLYVFGTESLRSAANHAAVLKRIKAETGIMIDIVSPRREAELSLSGIGLDTRGASINLMFEVGGGSVQIAELGDEGMVDEVSLALGTGRVIAEAGISHPVTRAMLDTARRYIESSLASCALVIDKPRAVACGGVVRGIWRALHPDGEKELTLEEIDFMAFSTSRLTTSRIIERYSVKAKRAGTLLPGALVYAALMRRFGCRSLLISEFGVREGAVLEMANGKIKPMIL